MRKKIVSVNQTKNSVTVNDSFLFSENHAVLVNRNNQSGMSLAKNLRVGDIIIDVNPNKRKKCERGVC